MRAERKIEINEPLLASFMKETSGGPSKLTAFGRRRGGSPHDRATDGPPRDEVSGSGPPRGRRRRLPRPHSPLDVLRAARAGEPGVALDPHPRPRGRPRALRLPDRAGARALPAAAGRHGNRAARRADHPLGNSSGRADRRAAQAGRPPSGRDPGRRQEDRRADGPRAGREGRASAGRGAVAGAGRSRGRRRHLRAREPGYRKRRGGEDGRRDRREGGPPSSGSSCDWR